MSNVRRVLAGMVATGLVATGLALFSGPATAGGFCHEPATQGTGIRVRMLNHCFTPAVVRVQPGQTVTWVNDDPDDHVVLGAGGAWGSDGDLLGGQTYAYRFLHQGVYPYFCIIHPGMIGTVVVGSGTATGTSADQPGEAVPVRATPVAGRPVASAPVESGQVAVWRAATVVLFVLLLGAVWLLGRRRPSSTDG